MMQVAELEFPQVDSASIVVVVANTVAAAAVQQGMTGQYLALGMLHGAACLLDLNLEIVQAQFVPVVQ